MTRYIDADALLAELDNLFTEREKEKRYTGNLSGVAVTWNDAIYHIKTAPTADVQPVKRGKWMHDSTGANFCSECGMYPYDDGEYHLVWHANYCPNCGAKMKMDGEDDG